jgi:hypothetical protein
MSFTAGTSGSSTTGGLTLSYNGSRTISYSTTASHDGYALNTARYWTLA